MKHYLVVLLLMLTSTLCFAVDLANDLEKLHSSLRSLSTQLKSIPLKEVALFSMFPADAREIIINFLNNRTNKIRFSIHSPEDIDDALFEKLKTSINEQRIIGWAILAQMNNVLLHPQSGFLFLANASKTMPYWKGKRQDGDFSLKDIVAHDSSEFRAGLVRHYKIHLMPKKGEEDRILWKILQESKRNPRIQELIGSIKIKEDLTKEKNRLGEVMPIIVIYPAADQKAAEELLNILYTLFKNQEGLDKTPRFNEKVTSLIYYAQSDADYKTPELCKKYFDPATNCAIFKNDFTGDVRDYHLYIKP